MQVVQQNHVKKRNRFSQLATWLQIHMALQKQLGRKRDCPNTCQFPFSILTPERELS